MWQIRSRAGGIDPQQIIYPREDPDRFTFMGEIALLPEEVDQSSPLSTNLAWLLSQAAHAMVSEMTAGFEDLGISPRGHCVLTTASTGEFTQKELADKIGLDKTTMVVTIDFLEKKGYALRTPSKSDRRARVISVTESGREIAQQGQGILAGIQADVLASVPDDGREQFMETLSELVCGRLSTPAACSRQPRRRS